MSEVQKPALPAIPDYLKRYVAETGPKASDASAMVSASSIPRVSLKAKKFRYIEEGEEIRAEVETHFVILSVEPPAGKMSKTYYEGAYNPGDTAPPTCASSDGIRPDAWVSQPQNDICATCRHNVFGSAKSRSGGKAKACRDSKRLWVVPPDKIDDTVYGLQVPVTSLKNLSELGQKIAATGMPLSAAVIKATMEEDESFPIVKFDVAGWLHENWGPKAIERNEKKDWPGALTSPNPPVVPGLINRSNGNGTVEHPQPKVGADGAIEGQATIVPNKPQPNVDEALKTWG